MNINLKPIYFVYFAVAFMMVGVIIGPVINPGKGEVKGEFKDDHSSHLTHDHSMMHKSFDVGDNIPPAVKLEVVKDEMSGWNLFLTTENFQFTPADVNKENELNNGHAHIYINGEKITRLYSNYFYLADLPPGEHEIVVSLNTNDHSDYVYNGNKVMSSVKIVQQ